MTAYGGSGFGGGPGPIQGTGVWFEVVNGSAKPIVLEYVNVEPKVVPRTSGDQMPRSLAAGETREWYQDVEDFELPVAEASRRPLLSRSTVLRYRLSGRLWERLCDGAPVLVEEQL